MTVLSFAWVLVLSFALFLLFAAIFRLWLWCKVSAHVGTIVPWGTLRGLMAARRILGVK